MIKFNIYTNTFRVRLKKIQDLQVGFCCKDIDTPSPISWAVHANVRLVQ